MAFAEQANRVSSLLYVRLNSGGAFAAQPRNADTERQTRQLPA
jgi:hypothetical protein